MKPLEIPSLPRSQTASEQGWGVFADTLDPVNADKHEAFQSKYFNDPEGFINNAIQFGPDQGATEYQLTISTNLITHRRICVRGPHGLGKTAFAAWIVLWFALTRDGLDWKIPTTAGSNRQLLKYLWPEIKKWSRLIRWDVVGRDPFNKFELQTYGLKLRTGQAFSVASKDPQYMEGAHADHVLFIFDEAKAIPDATFDAAEGALSNDSGTSSPTAKEALALVISTPGEPQGRFYQIQSKQAGYEDWHPIYVTKDQLIRAGRMARKWAKDRRKQWGAKSAVYFNRVLGKFASSGQDVVIDLAWVEASNELWHKITKGIVSGKIKRGKLKCLGVDVADGGADKTVLAFRYEIEYKGRTVYYFTKLKYHSKGNPMVTAGRVVKALRKHPIYKKHIPLDGLDDMEDLEDFEQDEILEALEEAPYAIIDAVGVGSGTTSRVRELGYNTMAFVAQRKTKHKDEAGELGMVNMRAAAWWNARELLDPTNENVAVALPPDPILSGDLVAPTWSVNSGGRILVEAKKSIKKRTKRSTDAADAVVQNLWELVQSAKRSLFIGDGEEED